MISRISAERGALLAMLILCPPALAQAEGVDDAPPGVMGLFWESFDLFTILIVLGSVVSVAIIIR
ncbi:MAG: hypothetical protein ACTS27_12305, partial [Phycisphaerales bacterium]